MLICFYIALCGYLGTLLADTKSTSNHSVMFKASWDVQDSFCNNTVWPCHGNAPFNKQTNHSINIWSIKTQSIIIENTSTISITSKHMHMYKAFWMYFCLQQMMSTATQILQHLRFVQNESNEHSSNVKAVVKRLTNTIRPFTHQLNSINQIYTSIHVFFFIYEKVCKNSSSL